ncbi:uncharacterized protein LOC126843305 [Adelges cooleyi]|uniref:uncharacterized protein LOC126843305 n=1 Tax=Adelges cooleyi TaxID=133065 RepID=UPI00217F837F|nr:uncharacterized protein LOC126843305 [Adelges cooleyi]
MTKFNMNVVSSDMRARLEFMMNIYNRLILSNPGGGATTKNGTDYCSLNGYIKLMQCATNSKKQKKPNKISRSSRPLAYRNINITSSTSHKSYKNYSSTSSLSSRPTISRSPSSLLFDFENNPMSTCFEETKRLLWMGCKTVDDALDVNRDLPMWVQTVDSNNIVKQLLASVDAGRVDKGNVHTLVAVFINFSITMIDMFAMNANVDKHWWKHSYKIMEQLIDDINVHCRSKEPLNGTLKVKGKSGDRMLNKALSTITQLKKIIPSDKPENGVLNSNNNNNHFLHNPVTPLVSPVSQQPAAYQPPPMPPAPVDFNGPAQQYVNYSYSPNQNYMNGGYNYPGQYPTPQMNRPPYCPLQYRPPYQPPPPPPYQQQYANQVRVNQPQYYQYVQQQQQQQPPNPWPNSYQKPAYPPVHNNTPPFPAAQFAVSNPQPKPEAKLVEVVKEDDEKKWLEAQKDAKQLVNNAIGHSALTTRSTTDSSNTSHESEEGLINLHATFERVSDRDSGSAPLPDDTDRMWNFLAREVDKKVRYKFQKMIREMQDIPKDEFSREPELYDTTYQNVVRIQLFEPIRCKMINKKYENVQAVVRDFRLVFSTFRHISQQSNDIKCKLMMDFMERYFNECLRKYFRGWNLDKYRPGVVDVL